MSVIISIIQFLISAYIIYKCFEKYDFKITYGIYVGISLLSLGVLIKLAINLINSNINIDDLLVLTTSISNLIINIINDILFELSEKSNICIVAGITAIIITAILKNINFTKQEK